MEKNIGVEVYFSHDRDGDLYCVMKCETVGIAPVVLRGVELINGNYKAYTMEHFKHVLNIEPICISVISETRKYVVAVCYSELAALNRIFGR